ncbi:MAG: DUF4390 domain-containing protein [Thermodesulfobacteriota bacterium]
MKKLLLSIAFIFTMAVSANALAAKAQVGGLKVTTAPEALSITFSVENAFPEGIEEAIKSGVPTSFNFIVEFTRRRRMWFDKDMGRWNFKHTVKYDTLKEEYEITLEEKGFEKLVTKDYEEMKHIMSSPDSVVLLPSWGLPRGYRYELNIMAELRTIRLPFRLDYMFFFLRLWDIDTDWYSYKFTY